MRSLWNDKEAKQYTDDLQLRVYTSQLLGKDPSLVLHGGGNTSVKIGVKNLFQEEDDYLFVKGSGWDLASIQAPGMVPVKLDVLKKLVQLDHLTDTEMVRQQRCAMLDPSMPAPSVEAILHAIIPFSFVDHTHADAVVTLTNTAQGTDLMQELYQSRLLIVPYVMPGFLLAKKISELTQDIDWKKLEGIILLHHGVFTFADDAKTSYERMLQIVTVAEDYLTKTAKLNKPKASAPTTDLVHVSKIRQTVSQAKGSPVVITLDSSPAALDFANDTDSLAKASRGPLTPDHVIRTKPFPVQISEQPEKDISDFVTKYQTYFERNTNGTLTCLNTSPCWALWPQQGILSFGSTKKDSLIINDIKTHTVQAIQQAEALGGWNPLPEKDIFELEYWELEQAKLKKTGKPLEFQGKIVLVTGAASGIGQACVQAFHTQGACVAALDINPDIQGLFQKPEILELVCDVTDAKQIESSVRQIIATFGGLDIIVSNAGVFPSTQKIDSITSDHWERSLQVNLSSHQQLWQICLPYLQLGLDPALVVMATRNVAAPGPGAASYSVAKAGLTQLARIAALEFAPLGIRVNVLHPHLVFDTKLWTDELIAQRAEQYGMSVEEYKSNNLLKVEITSQDVAVLACCLAGSTFSKSTGVQIPIDGGNDRVI
jgi:rhamnose utilization protein RhaD (predicted bifunctional aldolase and dehydrogenase)/NAD(P)-dependent dehydrogenase (short-subunit alcohol dehydrogenase family)